MHLIFFLYISSFTAITKIKTCFFLHLSFYKHNFNFESDIFILVNKHNSSIVVKINLAKAGFNLNLALNTWESPFKSRFRNYKSSVTPFISSGATNIAEVSSGFHQADWSNTLIVHCYLISFLFCFICLLFLLVSRTQLDCAHMQTSGQFKFALYITND